MINRLYWASKIYSTSYGIAWFNLDLFIKILRYIELGKVVTDKELNVFLSNTYREKFIKTIKGRILLRAIIEAFRISHNRKEVWEKIHFTNISWTISIKGDDEIKGS